MAGWTTDGEKTGGVTLIQNCDLPPPAKIFAGNDETQLNGIYSLLMGQEDEKLKVLCNSSENEKLEILRALRLSQTRAREAERKAAALAKERDFLSRALLEESWKLYAHRQWVKLLELQLSKLQTQQQHFPDSGEDNREGASGGMAWILALTLTLGLVLGCRCLHC